MVPERVSGRRVSLASSSSNDGPPSFLATLPADRLTARKRNCPIQPLSQRYTIEQQPGGDRRQTADILAHRHQQIREVAENDRCLVEQQLLDVGGRRALRTDIERLQ